MVFDSLVGCRLWNKSRLEKRSFLESSAIPEIQRAVAPLKGLVVLVRSTEAHEAKIRALTGYDVAMVNLSVS